RAPTDRHRPRGLHHGHGWPRDGPRRRASAAGGRARPRGREHRAAPSPRGAVARPRPHAGTRHAGGGMMSEQALPSSRRSWLATLVVVLIAGTLAFAFREPLRVWFAPLWGEAPPPPSEAPTPTATPEAHHEHRVETTPVPVLPEAPLPDAVLTSVRAALEAYERLRAALVADRLD